MEVKKSQYKKVIKASQKVKKQLSLKGGSEQKNQKSPKLKTLAANQDHFLTPKQGKPLPNWGKRLLRLQY